ncbi:MAG: prolipoprotein diacylglyceryl transferase [Winkia neuii]|uniref:prolipoprotein diacylglyceryl transferase n=1 Tax=Winkia neuii TaxID=33007 RepID=UPI000763CCFF|nr:prolipoprotein diacylglyceryl transferase [Winkia neuii]MDU3134867.1 prolipoprotein diacylglyceryl transferase [Winkia neuii]
MRNAIPSPSQGVWHLGPIPVRAYALAILAGIVVAFIIGKRRYKDRGGDPDLVLDTGLWAVIFGILGARLYHVITDWQLYFSEGARPIDALKIWNGGLGIWGGVAGGAIAGAVYLRHRKAAVAPFADSIAPGILVAQAIGRLGNYFNQELFGRPTNLPWGLQIDAAHVPPEYAPGTLFHPTFLYELIWNLAAAGMLIFLDRKKKFCGGQVFALYIVFYAVGRIWVEMLRIDRAHIIFGLRLNVWTTAAIAMAGVVAYIILGRKATSTTVISAVGAAPQNAGANAQANHQTGSTEIEEERDTVKADPLPNQTNRP